VQIYESSSASLLCLVPMTDTMERLCAVLAHVSSDDDLKKVYGERVEPLLIIHKSVLKSIK